MNKRLLTAAGLSMCLPVWLPVCMPMAYAQHQAQARSTTIYKLVDDNGRVTYSNMPMKGAVKIDLDPITTLVLPASSPSTRAAVANAAANIVANVSLAPPGLSAIDGGTQKKRDDIRRRILEDEARNEEKLLTDAKVALKEQENDRTVIMMMRAAAEKQSLAASVEARRAYDQREEKLKSMQDSIGNHEKNVEAIRKELTALK